MKGFQTIITHQLHLDEAVAIALLHLFGKNKGIDISRASIEIVYGNKLPDGKTWQELEDEGVLCVGEGGGRFDEHGKSSVTHTCAAKLVANHLGISEMDGVKTILAEVCEFDKTATATKTAFGTVIKNRFIVCSRGETMKVVNWAIEGARDMITCFAQGKSIAFDYDAYAAVFAKAWNDAAQSGAWTNDMYERAAKDFNASATNERKLMTDISYVYFYMTAVSGKDKADAWLYAAAYDAVLYQKQLVEAQNEFVRNARVERTDALVGGREVKIQVAFIRTNSRLMDKVYRTTEARRRFGNIDLLVQVNASTGNAAVFFNHQSGLYGDDLARMIRWAEIDLSGRNPHGWESLNRPEDLEFVPEWYYHRTNEIGKSAMYNGSLSHPHIRPTRISPEGLVRIVRHAFHPNGVKIWRREHDAFDQKDSRRQMMRRAG